MNYNRIRKPLYIAVFALLLVALLLWYFIGGRPSVTGLFRDGAYGAQIELDTSFGYATRKYNGGVAVFGKEGIVGIANSGRQAWEIDFPVTNPILSCSGRYVLAAERGGKKLILAAGGNVRQEMETDETILYASVNSKGAFAVVTEERGYKGRVKVYDVRGKELYAWHSADQNILSAAVSEDNRKLAVSVVNMTDLSRLCTVLQFDLQETSPRILDVGNENLVANIVYNGSELLAVGDEALYYFKKDGTEKFRLDYGGRELQKYSFYPGGVLCMGFWGGAGGSAAAVEFYDLNGNCKGSCAVSGTISGMDTFGRYAVVATQDGLMVIGQNGKVKARQEETGIGAEKIFLCGSRNRVFLLSGISAGMYIL